MKPLERNLRRLGSSERPDSVLLIFLSHIFLSVTFSSPPEPERHRQENVGQKNRIPRTGQLPQPK